MSIATHGPFRLDHWWDRDTGRYNCVIHYGKLSVHVDSGNHVYGSQEGAEVLAWREMATKLAGRLEKAQGQELDPDVTPMSMGITP